MADEEYNKKVESLQQYIPFLDNMIAQLKDPSKKNREQQLSKMESLHSMITDRKKKLKLETLNKCEDVITKLYLKVNHKPFVPKKDSDRSPLSTPSSPTPEQHNFFKAVTIPTERSEPKSHIPKVDIYSSAAESLRRSKLQESPRHSGKVADLSKPPISLDDLKCLEVDVREKINENASLRELNAIRNKIATELIFENIKSIITPTTSTTVTNVDSNVNPVNSNTTARDATKKIDTFFEASLANSNNTDTKTSDEKSNLKKPISLILKPKASPKILKEPASIFGSILSNIDEKIIGDTKKKFERRSSTEKTWTSNDSKKESNDSKRESNDSKKESNDSKKESNDSKKESNDSKKESTDSKKERRNSKDEKRSSRDDKKSSKEEKKHSKEKKQSKEDKKIHKEEKKIAREERRNSKEEKRNAKEEKNSTKDESNYRNFDLFGNKFNKEKEFKAANNDADLKIGENKLESNTYTTTVEKIKTECDFIYDDLDTQPAPIPSKIGTMSEPKVEPNTPYKRLADKYNPKPRKSNVDADVDKAVTDIIEANMKVSPPKLPPMPKPEPPPPPPASLVKCAQQMDVELFRTLQANLNPPHTNINHPHTNINSPHININPPHTNINPPKPLMNNLIQRQSLLCNPPNPHVSPSILMSPRDNFISDYARDEFNTLNHNRRPVFEQTISVISSSRFMPPQPQQNQMFNPAYNNYNQNHMDPGPPPLLDYQAPQSISSRPYNAGPPLLSPEMPHFYEQKHNFGTVVNRDMFLPKEDLRWRLEDNRPTWDRREFEQQRFRGPMTYKEHRELRENTRDPRLLRDPRERTVPRETRDFRDLREIPRDPREIARDPREIARDPREMARDPREMVRDPREMARDPREMARDPREMARDTREMARDPREMARDPREMARDPREMARDPREIARDPREIMRDPWENRDIRENRVRDPRDSSENRDREIKDPRMNRDKFQELKEKESKGRETKERESKERESKERESKERENKDSPEKATRDPRLSKEGSDSERGKSRSRYESTKFDRIYSTTNKDDSRSTRSDSKSKSTAEKKESFISPLDSLYVGKEEHRTGKGYGVQPFRIPKKKIIEKKPQIIDLSEDTIDNDNVGVSGDESPSVEKQSEKELDQEYKNNKATDNKATPESNTESNLETKSDKENTDIPQKIVVEEPTIILDLEHDAQAKPESENVTQPQTSLKNEETKPPTEQTILAHFFSNLLSSQNKKDKKTALYSLISTFSDTFSTKELEKITKIINTNEEDAVSDEDEHPKEKEEKPTADADDTKNVTVETEEATVEQIETVDDNKTIEHEDETTEPVIVPNISKRKLRSRRISSCSSSIDKSIASTETSVLSESIEDILDAEAPLVESAENVIVSVGERIKSRRRIASRPKKKCRSELDKLHEDIQEMFIRDGVLTASGRRMCNLLKDDPCVLTNEPELTTNEEEAAAVVVKSRKKPGPKPKHKPPNESEVKAMKNVRVMIQKIPEMEKTSVARRLTRSMTVVEGQEDEEISGSSKEVSGAEDTVDENSDTEKDTLSQTSTDTQKSKERKRKRLKSSWASGVIKKKKKKQSNADDSTSQKSPEPEPELEPEENPEHTMGDFLTPDKNYYVNFASQKTYACRLCEFQGKFITTHYKTTHPESEVMSSRFSPAISAEAIEDAKKNMDRYEKYQDIRPSTKIFYICRFCDFNTTVVPTLFYDHLSTHTGEYRHVCPSCNSAFCNAKSLKSHIQNSHPEQEYSKPVQRKAYNSNFQFGYLCGECNYVQISKTNMDEHVNIYHLEKPSIYKVNLSSHVDEKIKQFYEEKQDRQKAALEQSSQKEAEIKTKSADVKKPVESNEKKQKVSKELPADPDISESVKTPEVPPKIKKPIRNKPGPKSRKKIVENSEPSVSIPKPTSAVASEASIPKNIIDKPKFSRADATLDTEKILPFRSKRAAKEKAQEKLKEIMEVNEGSHRKKSIPEENKNTKAAQPETDLNTNNKKEEIKDNASSDKSSSVVEETLGSETDASSVREEIVNEPSPAPTPYDLAKVVKKEIEMNVFTCNTDIQEENKKIEQERLQKMDELNKSFGSRTSLNFTDKLCNRLNQDVPVKEEPKDDFIDTMYLSVRNKSPIPMPVLEKNPSTSVSMEKTPVQVKKQILESVDSHVTTPTFDVAQKNDRNIMNMIEKLRGKLDADDNFKLNEMETDDDNDGPPPLTHVNELTNIIPSDASVKTLEVCGLLKVIKSIDSTTFSCLVPPCVFSTENQDQFQIHCKENHVYGVPGRSSTLCESCGMEINTTDDANLLENLFKHTIVHHADFITSNDRSTKPPARMLRIRKLSGDALSVIKKDEEPEEKVTPSEMTDIKEPSAGLDTENKSPDANDQAEDNPFPFKISGVMSLAEPQAQPQLPPLTPIAKPAVPILVKEAKMTAAEIARPKKTQKALAKFIEDVGNLYKCPYYYCVFTTNFREFLERHLKAHNLDKDYMVPCVYCDLKTPWEHVAIHIDIRHANCKYACSYCLYRACLKNYVFLHQDRSHPLLDYSVIALPASKAAKKFAIADIKIDPKTLCEPYKCLPTCHIEFLFENEFNEHLTQQHQGFLTCGHDDCSSRVMVSKMIHHWSVAHAISVYQCSYCKTNSNELNLMYHHLSQAHQNLNPEILVRIISPKPDNMLLGYSAEAFKRMRRIATLPNITEGEKDEVPPMVQEPVKTAQYIPPLQVVTSAPQNNLSRPILLSTSGSIPSASTVTTSNVNLSKPILLPTVGSMPPGSSVTTSSGNVYLVTNSPVGGLKMNTTTQHSLLKANTTGQNALLKVTPTSLTKVNAAGQNSLMNVNGGQMNLSVIGSVNQTTSTITTKALTLPTQSSTMPALNASVQMESSNLLETAPSIASLAPLEHVTLSEETNQDDISECDVDPLDLGDASTSKTVTYSSEDESESGKSKLKSGLLGYQLFRCAQCEFSCSNCSDFRKHVAKSADCLSTEFLNKPYICIHCRKPFRSPHILAEHIQCHGVHRYSCSLCAIKFPNSSQARLHMKTRHSIGQTTQSLLPGKLASGCEEFIIKPKSQMSESVPKETINVELPLSSTITDNIYGPDEIEKIPIRSIFSSDLKCGICTYTTKVRTNMVRHLQFHSQEKAVPDSAPVNPVPCLEKNEKMFDKMINLASSSHKSKMGGGGKSEKDVDSIPEFIPSHTRYTCCAQGCNYICPEEANLRHHLMALHDGETSFVCVHCKAQLTPTDTDSLIKHLKLHGLQLYKCQYCSVVHHFKHKVEKHCNDAHADVPNKVLTIRHLETEPVKPNESSSSSSPPVANLTKPNKLWRCLMCKFKTSTEEGVRIHASEKHEIETQYKCALCAYKSDDKSTFAQHYKDHHPKQDIDIIHSYRKFEEEKEGIVCDSFDTTPLWQRDRPRIKHIRGILFDDAAPTSASKSPKKPTKTATSINAKSATRNLDMAIESVATGSGTGRKDDGIDFIEKVNKLMKDTPISPVKEPSDVIVIDDDDDTQVVSQKVAAKRKSTETIHQSAKVVKTEDTKDVGSTSKYAADDGDDDEDLEKNIRLDFGQFGLPLNKQLKCPVCNKFKSKRISDFIFHLFKEKRVYRYKCALCGDESITYRYMSKHVKEHEEEFNLDYIITLDRNPKLELWLQMLIRSQCTRIVPSLAKSIMASSSDPKKVLCRYCNRWYKNEQERNEHALTHWSCIPYKCGDCQFTSYSRNSMKRHCTKIHASANPNIIEMGPTVLGELQHSDYLHMKEVEDELVEPLTKEAITEVLVPATTISNMIDESEQDGTVLGMADILEPDVNIMDVDSSYQAVNDLVIVSKTDTNVPQNGDAYCCEYCPYMSNSEPIMLSHISGQHDNMHIKFKVLNQRTCFLKKEEFVACMICDEVGSEIQIRQHHMKVHDGETFVFYRYVCNACNKKFCKVTGLKLHSQRVHPGVPVTYTGLFNNIIGDVPHKFPKEKRTKASSDATPARNLLTVLTPTVKGWKRYACTECSYQRDFPPSGVNNVRCHVKTHFKPYLCGECGLKSKTKTDSVSHFRTNHTGLVENIIYDKDAEESFQECMRIIHSEAMPIPDPNAARQEVKGKTVAKKSTSTRYVPPMEEFSYYGRSAEKEDLFKIMTTVEINGICLDMTADKLGKIFDLNPIVALQKCDAEPPIIEIDS